MMVLFDQALAEWAELENEMKLIPRLGHMGVDSSSRKANSHAGKPDLGEDRGNWGYACCLRSMLTFFSDADWRVQGTSCLNDESTGDIMEAIWGVLWHRRSGLRVPGGGGPGGHGDK